MSNWVEIIFDCLPFRHISRFDVPLDASPKYRERCFRVKSALEKHGSHNTYYLFNGFCTYRLTNDPSQGMLVFQFEGTLLTDTEDCRTESCDLSVVQLAHETCNWITEPVVTWFRGTVSHSVTAEFNRYIEAGDLDQAKERIEQIESASDASGGFLGMYL